MRLRTCLGPILLVAVLGGYTRWVRPWQLTWGATPDEVSRALPGDELVAAPNFAATRAVTIKATPAEIWPWIVQVGVCRAGWYSYDLLDNLGRPSARRVIPELQHLVIGDIVPLSPDGKRGMQVLAMRAPRSMIWGTPGDTTWEWRLTPDGEASTRLVTRVRSRYRWNPLSLAFSFLIEFADIWMMRRMLLNLRDRVEQHSVVATGRTDAR